MVLKAPPRGRSVAGHACFGVGSVCTRVAMTTPSALSSNIEDESVELPYWSRTYAGYRERFVEPYVLELSDGRVALTFEQAPCVSAEHAQEAKATADGSCTASTVWDAGIVLAAHAFCVFSALSTEQPVARCLDLGSGTGIVGIAVAASGHFAETILTDLPSVVPLLERNASGNASFIPQNARVRALALRWDDRSELGYMAAQGPFDYIFGGDLLYRPQVVEPLLTALKVLVSKRTTLLLASSLQHSPETISLFTEAAKHAGFSVEYLESSAHSEALTSPEVKLLRLRRARTRQQRASASVAESASKRKR